MIFVGTMDAQNAQDRMTGIKEVLAGTNISIIDIRTDGSQRDRAKANVEDTLAKYPDCDDATVEKKMMRVYRADGTGESQDETYTKVLTEKGRRNNRTLSLSFTIPYSTVQVVRLEVIKPDGQIVPVDVAANSKETIDDSQMQMNIFDPHNKILQVNIPSVGVGDVVHSVVRQNIDRSIVSGQYAEETVLEGPGYIRHTSYEIHAPADSPLVRVVLRDEVPGTVTYAKETGPEGGVIHHWEIHNVPRMFDEPAMRPTKWFCNACWSAPCPIGRRCPNGTGT